jgi:acetoin utilization protein AcuC
MRAPVFIGSEIYRRSSYGGRHPLAIPRVSTVMDLARALGWLPGAQYRNSPRARPAALTGFHTPDYVTALIRAEAEGAVDAATRERHALGTFSNPVFPEIFRRPATGAGGVMLAAELVRGGGVVHVPGGGTHHALPDRANGFCYLNDPVLCIRQLRALGLRRIAYVDIDAHHCDGVEAAFAGAPDVLMVSVHEERRWPFTGRIEDDGSGNAFNLPVPRGFGDAGMALARDRLILPALEAFEPEAVVLQSGADGVAEDPLSRLALSNGAHAAMALALRAMSPRLIVLGGGGYNPWSVGRCWTRIWGALNGYEAPGRLPREAGEVLEALAWPGRAAGRSPPREWKTTLADPPRAGLDPASLRAPIAALRARLDGLRDRMEALAEARARAPDAVAGLARML